MRTKSHSGRYNGLVLCRANGSARPRRNSCDGQGRSPPRSTYRRAHKEVTKHKRGCERSDEDREAPIRYRLQMRIVAPVRSAWNLAKVVVVVIRHRGDPAGELLCEFRMYPLLPQVPDTVDDREIDRLAFAPSSTVR